jgi:hypothetical protein
VRQAALGLGFFLIASCSGSSKTGESETGSSAAAAGEDGESGRSGSQSGGTKSRGGAAGTAEPSSGGNANGGSSNGGSSNGGSSSGGTTQGGTAQGGVSGLAGGAGEPMGEGGEASGSGGSVSGTGGTAVAGSGGNIVAPVCDPASGELDNTPYPNCAPRDPTSACEACIQANCCEESKVCFGYDPGNVCGWGGPTTGDYAGLSEIDCYVLCARAYVAENLAYDDRTADVCVPACTTSACGLIGNATQDLVACLNQNCEDACFGQP